VPVVTKVLTQSLTNFSSDAFSVALTFNSSVVQLQTSVCFSCMFWLLLCHWRGQWW